MFGKSGASEVCHFCKQRVYLMEKISAEGLLLHRACLKCHHCHTSLRLGGYAFDRDDPNGRFYCTQHFRLPAKVHRPIPRRSVQRTRAAHRSELDVKHPTVTDHTSTPDRRADRDRREGKFCKKILININIKQSPPGQTPERIEFENADALSDGEPSIHNIIDENEWTDRNFGTGTEESDSDLSDTTESDSDSESEEYEEAEGSPLEAHTLKLANDWIGQQRHSSNQYSDDEFYDSSDGTNQVFNFFPNNICSIRSFIYYARTLQIAV